MSEFLKNFRSAQNSRYSGRRNPYDGHYYGQDLRSGNDRRASQSGNSNTKQPDRSGMDLISRLDEIIPALKSLLENMAEQQDELFELKQRNAANMDVIAAAFHEIAIALGGSSVAAVTPPREEPRVEPQSGQSGLNVAELEKEGMQSAASQKREIIKLMKKLRKKGGTYKEIAAFLNEKEIPTFSNNGKWHAQTIHRLCSK